MKQFIVYILSLFFVTGIFSNLETAHAKKPTKSLSKQAANLQKSRLKRKLASNKKSKVKITKYKATAADKYALSKLTPQDLQALNDAYTQEISPNYVPGQPSENKSHASVESDDEGVTSQLNDNTFEKLSR